MLFSKSTEPMAEYIAIVSTSYGEEFRIVTDDFAKAGSFIQKHTGQTPEHLDITVVDDYGFTRGVIKFNGYFSV